MTSQEEGKEWAETQMELLRKSGLGLTHSLAWPQRKGHGRLMR